MKDHVRVELTFHKTLPTLPVYKRRAENRRQPTAARQPPPPTTRPTPPARRQPATPEKETTPPAPPDTTDRHTSYHHNAKTTEDITDHAITYHPETSYTASFSRITTDKEAENSRRRRTLHPSSTFMSTLRKSTLYMRSTTSRMSPLQSSRPSPKLKDYQETTKKSTSTCQSTSSTIEKTNIGLLSRDEVLRRSLVRLHRGAL